MTINESAWDAARTRAMQDKVREVDTIASGLLSNTYVTLAVDASGYGEGGWHQSSSDLDEHDARVVALGIWYDLHRLPAPDAHVLRQEAAALPRPGRGEPNPLWDLALHLRQGGWCAETSASPEEYETARYGVDASPYGQCAVTALLVQQVAGGTLARVEVTDTVHHGWQAKDVTVSHYYNVLADGTEVDLTRGQFNAYSRVTAPAEKPRAYLLSHEGTVARYRLLAERVGLPYVEHVTG